MNDMSPGFRDYPRLRRRRSGSIRDRRIGIPGLEEHEGPFRVLLVDDAPVNLAVCSRMLGRMGCEVEPATTGEYALAMFRDGCPEVRYDLVLMDLNMPGMNGVEASREIRRIEADLPPAHAYRERRVPILLMTSYMPGDEMEEYREAGVSDFICKPFQPEGVQETLSRWIPLKV